MRASVTSGPASTRCGTWRSSSGTGSWSLWPTAFWCRCAGGAIWDGGAKKGAHRQPSPDGASPLPEAALAGVLASAERRGLQRAPTAKALLVWPATGEHDKVALIRCPVCLYSAITLRPVPVCVKAVSRSAPAQPAGCSADTSRRPDILSETMLPVFLIRSRNSSRPTFPSRTANRPSPETTFPR